METRRPGPLLAPYVSLLWVSASPARPGARELVLPTGAMHLAIRVCGTDLGLYTDLAQAQVTRVSRAVLGGARALPYLRDVGEPVCSVGAQLKPGAAQALFGVPADVLAGRHTPLDALWGASAVESLCARLAEAPVQARLDLFEARLVERVRARAALHPAIAEALVRLGGGADVGTMVRASGFSHRHLSALFRAAVGLGPKQFVDVRRFAGAVARMADAGPAFAAPSLAAVALDSGYCDQGHFSRAFRAHGGLTPARYRALAPRAPHHVVLAQADAGGERSSSSKTERA